MNRGLIKYTFALIVLLGSLHTVKSQCSEMKPDYMKDLLGDAVYDNFRRTEIKNSENPYDVEFQVDLLKNFVYKLAFDMSAKSEGVVVKLYDLGVKSKKDSSEPKLIYTSSEDIMDENAMFNVTFEAPRTRMLIKYEVKDATYAGCVTFALGVFLRNKGPETTDIKSMGQLVRVTTDVFDIQIDLNGGDIVKVAPP